MVMFRTAGYFNYLCMIILIISKPLKDQILILFTKK